jgi:hypothetical protein
MTTRSVKVGWFEIPVNDMERAMAFYQEVFNTTLARNTMDTLDMAWFPGDEGTGATGSLVHHAEFYEPSLIGTLVYFMSENVSDELNRVEAAGGMIIVPKTEIGPEIGFMAVFKDTEGNRVALHSMK